MGRPMYRRCNGATTCTRNSTRCKLSTTLYKRYNNVILDSILKSGLGACIGDIQVPAPTCADDIAVLANSTADAQGILDIVQHHTSRDLVKINPTKSEVVLSEIRRFTESLIQQDVVMMKPTRFSPPL
ncbi:Hypothetical predicted protein [Mytilus galloprovincialis]|uniref:Reverse transcriptase domain-containing protein n=1 Tax=Mytilus galloprovincialis TaxID=29158 RepID=A0A8B6GSL3_MYTGA|nr:Hypothetical predicted protein [Mytilus galloprovincialis]